MLQNHKILQKLKELKKFVMKYEIIYHNLQ